MSDFVFHMKTALALLLVILGSTATSQEAMTFRQAEAQSIRVSLLDSLYHSALHSDSTKAVFWHKQEEFISNYQKMLGELGNFLKTNNFIWGKQTRCFNRIYFDKEGRVDYFLYNFSKGEVTPEKEQEFENLLKLFIKDFTFPMRASKGYSQCSPVRYND